MKHSDQRLKPRAVILAAGRSSRFFPPLYDRPKGLFEFRGEILIERQIAQLKEAGIDEITVVIGYEKERFFYLEEMYGVNLLVSEKYAEEGSLASLCMIGEGLEHCYICCADHWYDENPFYAEAPSRAIRLIQNRTCAEKEFVVRIEGDGRISSLDPCAVAGECMVGLAFFTEDFARRFVDLYERERECIGVPSLHWEQFWGRHADELPLYSADAPLGFYEFDSLEDLQRLDANVLNNVSHIALANICSLLKCTQDDISEIQPLNKGLTNVSFSFRVRGDKYVYRHPGASSSNMVNRKAEVIAQEAAIDAGIDSSVLAISEEGWKLSRYIEAVKDFDYADRSLLKRGIEQIKQFHALGVQCDYSVDLLSEGDRLLLLASNKKGDLAARYSGIHERLVRLWHHCELDGMPKVLCHNDSYAVNWIVGRDALCMIDWEYAGMNDPVNDIATLVVRDGLGDEDTEAILEIFFDGTPSADQRRHAYGCFALCGWYWFCWSLFKDTLGEDGFFMLPSWRALNKYLPLALAMYGEDGKACR